MFWMRSGPRWFFAALICTVVGFALLTGRKPPGVPGAAEPSAQGPAAGRAEVLTGGGLPAVVGQKTGDGTDPVERPTRPESVASRALTAKQASPAGSSRASADTAVNQVGEYIDPEAYAEQEGGPPIQVGEYLDPEAYAGQEGGPPAQVGEYLDPDTVF